MERLRILALKYVLQARWLSESEHTHTRLLTWRTDDGNGLGQERLVARMSVQVERRQEARLCWMRVDPAYSEQIVLDLVCEQLFFAICLAAVVGAGLLGNDKVCHIQSIEPPMAQQIATRLALCYGIRLCMCKETRRERARQHNLPQYVASLCRRTPCLFAVRSSRSTTSSGYAGLRSNFAELLAR